MRTGSLTTGSVTGAVANTILVEANGLLEVTGEANFGTNATNVTLTGGEATFAGKVTLGSNTNFTLSQGGIADFRQGLAISGSGNRITALDDSNNILVAGNTGITAGTAGAITLGDGANAGKLYVMKNADEAATGDYGTGSLRVTAARAITVNVPNGSALHVGDYVIGQEVRNNGGLVADIYNAAGGEGSVYARTFTVESGANARGSDNVQTVIAGDVDIEGRYVLGASNEFLGDTVVTGTLATSGAGTFIATGDDSVFTVDGGTLDASRGTLSLTAGDTNHLNFIRDAGTVKGTIEADDFAMRVATDLSLENAIINAATYVQEGGSVTGSGEIVTSANSTTYFRNNAEYAVNGDFGGNVNFISGSKLIGNNNTLSTSNADGVLTFDNTSFIDLRNGNLRLDGFETVRNSGYLQLGADVDDDELHLLTLAGGTALNLDLKNIQMNKDFLDLYYNNRTGVIYGGLDGDNHFIDFAGDAGSAINSAIWTVSNAFGDFTFKTGTDENDNLGGWVETYTKTDVRDVAAVERQLDKVWGHEIVSNSVAGVTALAAQSYLALGSGLGALDVNGFANNTMLQAMAANGQGGYFDLGNGVAGAFDRGIMGVYNGEIASGPIWVAQDTFRDVTTGLHSRLDAYRRVIECINIEDSAAVSAAYGSLGLASVDRYMNRIWAGGFGSWQDANSRKGFSGYTFDSAGVSLGFDRSFGPAVLGASFTYAEGQYEEEAALSNDSKIKQYVANIFATVNGTNGFFASVMGGYSYQDNDIKDVRGGLSLGRDFHTNSFYAGGRLGYDIEPSDNFVVSPSIGADFFWSKSSEHDVTIAGSALAPWRYREMKNHNIEIPVEVKMAYDINFGTNKTLTLMANGGYAYNLNDHAVWGGMALNGTNAPELRAIGRQLGHHAWKGGAGIRFRMNQWDIAAKYDYQGRSNYNAHRLTAQVGYSF